MLDKKYMSSPGYDDVVIFKDVDVGDKLLERNIQEVYRCRKIGKVYGGRTNLVTKDLQLDPQNIEVIDANPYLSYIRF